MESVTEAIDDCSAVLLLVTANSNGSNQVRRELERAVSKSKTIIPLILEEVQFSKWMQYSISIHHWYSAQKTELSRGLEAVTNTLKASVQMGDPLVDSVNESLIPDPIFRLFSKEGKSLLKIKHWFQESDLPEKLLLEVEAEVRSAASSISSEYQLVQKYTERKTEYDFTLESDWTERDGRARIISSAAEFADKLELICNRLYSTGHVMNYFVAVFPTDESKLEKSRGLILPKFPPQFIPTPAGVGQRPRRSPAAFS